MKHITPNFIVYLASQSPRRRELLAQIGVAQHVLSIDIDEHRQSGEEASVYVQRLAREKAEAGWRHLFDQPSSNHQIERTFVIGADTAVVIDGDILGKPSDADDAMAILQR